MMRLTVVLTITLLILWLEPVSAIKRLHNMLDLASTKFGTQFPNNGLMLLYWFTLHIDFPDELTMKPKGFDPSRGDYGCKSYPNSERLLPKIPRDTDSDTYYIIGNLNHVAAKFPSYVYQDYYNAHCSLPDDQSSTTKNMTRRSHDRIFFKLKGLSSVPRYNTHRIVFRLKIISSVPHIIAVYVTQTTLNGLRLNPDFTFEVTPQLLREISDIVQQKTAILCPALKPTAEKAHNMFEDEKLVWFLTLADYDVSSRELCLSGTFCSDYTEVGGDCINSLHCTLGNNYDEVCDWNPMSLTVSSSDDGLAVVNWVNIPDTKAGNSLLMVALFQNDQSSDALAEKAVDGLATGSFSTTISLDAGLQVRLLLKSKETLWRGPELDDANGQMPVNIVNFNDASIQLFVRNGSACARLYIKKSFSDWNEKLYSGNSYMCYYASSAGSCLESAYLTIMVQTSGHKFAEFNIYEHCSGKKMNPLFVVKFYHYYTGYYTTSPTWGN